MCSAQPSPDDGDIVTVTPAMIEAGTRVLWKSGAVEHPMEDIDRDLIREVFLAMHQARP
jgi:hypothetical protein